MKTFFLSAITLISSLAYSQNKPLLYTWGDYNGTYSVSNIEDDGANFKIFRVETVSIEMLKARKKDDLVTILSNQELKSCNNVEVIEVSKNGDSKLQRKIYWMLPGNAAINPENNPSQFFSEMEISKMFPTMFFTKASPKFTFENRRIKTYLFDTYYQQYFLSKSDLITCEHPTRKDKMASNATYNTSYDVTSNHLVAVYPAEKNDKDKYFSFKNYEIIITTPSCQILNQVKVSFDYPRTYKEQRTVYDINDSQKSIGQLLIFERLNAGKEADPNKQNVQLVFCSNKGEIISSVVNFRPDNKGWEKIHGAFGDGENLYISFHAYGADGNFFGIKKISKNGESQDFKNTEEQLKANTTIPTGNFGQLNSSRKELGSLADKPAFRWGIQEFEMQGVQKTNTKLYIWGQSVYTVSDPNFKGEGMPPTISYYAEDFVFVYNSETLAFEKMFMLNRPYSKAKGTFNLIASKNDEVEFFIPIQSTEQKDYSKTVVEKNLNGDERFGVDYKHLMNPLFMTINGSDGKFQYYKDIYTLDLEKGLITCKDGSRYIVGFDAFAGMERDDSGVMAYNNEHFVHIIPVKYSE